MKKYFVILRQLFVLTAIYWLGNQLVVFMGLPIPGNVVGVLLLLGMLMTGVLKLHHVQEAADFLIKHMLLLFIPVAVGLIDMGGLFYDNALVFTGAIVISAVVPFWFVGFVTQLWDRRKKNCSN